MTSSELALWLVAAAVVTIIVVLAGLHLLLPEKGDTDPAQHKVRIERTRSHVAADLIAPWCWSCRCQPGKLRYAGSWEQAQVDAEQHLRREAVVSS